MAASNKNTCMYGTSAEILALENKVLDDLTPSQKEKVKELRKRVDDILDERESNYVLLPWLRTQKFKVKGAENMIRADREWREQFRVDFILEEYEPPEVLKKYYPLSLFSYDRDGSPFWICKFGEMDLKGLLRSTSKSEIIKYTIYLMEKNRIETRKQSVKLGKLIEMRLMLADLDNFDLKQFIWKPAIDLTTSLIKINEEHYPLTVKKEICVNAPIYFSVFFKLVKPFLGEEHRKNIAIFGKDTENWREYLLQYVDPKDLPVYWGGEATDELDGNQYCSSKISLAGSVPEMYYYNEDFADQKLEFVTTTVEAKQLLNVDIEVVDNGSTLSYIFKTENHDIEFGISFRQSSNSENSNEDNSSIVILPKTRVFCQLVPEMGKFSNLKAGTYTVLFDNSSSWYKDKILTYHIDVI